MNESLQELEIKVENQGKTPQGRISAEEWNILVDAVKSLDLTPPGGGGGSIEYPLSWSGYSQGMWDGSAPADIAIPSLMSQLENDEGYIKGVSSDMIVAALGYTPYDSANPNGYITPSALSPYATTASVNSLLTSYVQKSAIKSELGISDWALSSTKPSYTWSEIVSRPTSLSQFSNDVGYITNSVSGDFTADGMVRGTAYLSTGYKQISANIDASVRTSIDGDAGSHWGQIKAFRTGGDQTVVRQSRPDFCRTSVCPQTFPQKLSEWSRPQ